MDTPPFNQQEETEIIPPLSPKVALFELNGQQYLIESGYAVLFEESKSLRHYLEARASWLEAVEAFDFWIPKFPAASPAEQTLITWIFLELRHGDPAIVFEKYASFLQAKPDKLWKTVANILKERSIANNAPPSLDFYLLASWLHRFFWGLSNEHRVLLLDRVFGVPINSRADNPVALVKKTIERLKLKGYSSFPQTYSDAPILTKVYHQPGQDWQQDQCEIYFRSAGQM